MDKTDCFASFVMNICIFSNQFFLLLERTTNSISTQFRISTKHTGMLVVGKVRSRLEFDLKNLYGIQTRFGAEEIF